MSQKTLGELVAEFNNQPGVTISNEHNPALKAHDALHILFNLLEPSAKSEEIVTILQAVVKYDATYSRRRKLHKSGEDRVDLKSVYEKVIIPIHKEFLPYLCEKAGVRFAPYDNDSALGWNKMHQWFEVAQGFKDMFEEKYGKSYGDMPIDELMSLPAEPLFELAASAEQRAERIFSYLNSEPDHVRDQTRR